MSRAVGSNAVLLLKNEAAYGSVATGNFARLPFITCGLGSEQGLIESDVLGGGRDPAAPSQDVINVGGDVVVPLDLRDIGLWLQLIFGAPTTTGVEGAYKHTFESGSDVLPSASVEVGHPNVPSYFMNLGVMADSIGFSFERSGNANATINLLAQGETDASSSGGGVPTTSEFQRFSQFQGSIKKDGSALANVTGGSLNYSNSLDTVETIRSDGKIEGIDPGVASMTGNIDVRFADMSLMNAATNNTAVELVYAYEISATKKLIVTVHEVYLPKPKVSISGAGGVEASFDWQAAKNSAAGVMTTFELHNDIASY